LSVVVATTPASVPFTTAIAATVTVPTDVERGTVTRTQNDGAGPGFGQIGAVLLVGVKTEVTGSCRP
jgi:hypothetical protein